MVVGRSMEYKGYQIEVQDPLELLRGVGEMNIEKHGWTIPDVVIKPLMQSQLPITLKVASKRLKKGLSTAAATKDAAICEAKKFAMEAIDSGNPANF